MKSFFALLFLTFFTLTAQEKPLWIDDPSSAYPQSKYLTAVGSGDTRKAAESAASANLSQIFKATIKAEQTINERYKELFSAPDQSTFEGQTDITKNVTISTDQTLYNVQYAVSFSDNMGRTYVLAVLERNATAEIYRQKIQDNEKIMLRYIDQYEKSTEPIARYANINAAKVFSDINESLRQQLVIILPGSSSGQQSSYDVVKVNTLVSDAVKKLPFSITISGDTENRVTAILKEMLSEMGFVVANKGAITISGDVGFQEIDLKRPEKYVRWSYKLSVVEPSGASIVSMSENGREGHMTYDEAVNRALRTMKQKIKSNFGKGINKYFDAMVKK